MGYPAAHYADENDDYDDFLSDDSMELEFSPAPKLQNVPLELTKEEKIKNLYFYIINGNLSGVIGLLDEGLDVNVELQDDWKSIALATSMGDNEIVTELIMRGANVNDCHGDQSVLMMACDYSESLSLSEKSLKIVKTLLEHGVDTNAITKKKETALMFAACKGNVDIIRELLPHCDIFLKDYRGWNALFWAANNNKPEVVQILLNAGLNRDEKDFHGKTAAHYATNQGFEKVINIFSPKDEISGKMLVPSSYNVRMLFNNQHIRPQFLPDILLMLYGMRCENLQKLFVSTNLLVFLSLNDEALADLGVKVLYQRNRLLMGLHNFHTHLFTRSSLPTVSQNSFDTLEVSHCLLTIVRQVTIMEASLRYIMLSNCNFHDNPNLNQYKANIIIIRKKIRKIKKNSLKVYQLALKWDNNHKPVDLITRNVSYSSQWLQNAVGVGIIFTGVAVLVSKFCIK
ncbi:hypothetical protein FQA39_LY15068 [Lamprigera yunnana]|nr:hypothetical protein FQA39_LY15068 [Lamprigera yunnana]